MPVQVHERDRYGRFGGVFARMGPVDGPVRILEWQPLLLLGRIVILLRNLHAEEEKDTQDEADQDYEARIDQCVAPGEVALDQMVDGEYDDGRNHIEGQALGCFLEVFGQFRFHDMQLVGYLISS